MRDDQIIETVVSFKSLGKTYPSYREAAKVAHKVRRTQIINSLNKIQEILDSESFIPDNAAEEIMEEIDMMEAKIREAACKIERVVNQEA
jgi:DNA-directed RNA polymerase subunit F